MQLASRGDYEQKRQEQLEKLRQAASVKGDSLPVQAPAIQQQTPIQEKIERTQILTTQQNSSDDSYANTNQASSPAQANPNQSPDEIEADKDKPDEPQQSEEKIVLEVKKPYITRFPVPENTPKKIDRVKHIKPWLKQRRIIFGLWGLSAAVFVFGTSLTIYSILQNNKIIDQVSGGEVAGIAGGPSQEYSASEEPPDIGAYSVAPNMPRYVSIPKYNVKGRVMQVGVNETNNMDVPGNVFDAGWYSGSVLPGSSGASIINGHVSGYTQHGIFYNLKDLAKGDQVSVEMGSGKVLNYKVVSTKIIPADQFDILEMLNPIEGKEGLNLITCGGSFDSAANKYPDRVLVFTKRI